MSDKLREALDRLPRLRITGEQLDAIDPDPEKVFYTDWDEWDEYVRLDGAFGWTVTHNGAASIRCEVDIYKAKNELASLIHRSADRTSCPMAPSATRRGSMRRARSFGTWRTSDD